MKTLFIAASALAFSGAAMAYQNADPAMPVLDADQTMPVDASQMRQDTPETQTDMEYDRTPVATADDLTPDAARAAEAGMLHQEQWAGMGGPYEEVYGAQSLNLTPRPATENYAACDPGPGDDNCIQLYEPGVRTALASWSGMGGYIGTEAQSAMGGPYEPVDHPADREDEHRTSGD